MDARETTPSRASSWRITGLVRLPAPQATASPTRRVRTARAAMPNAASPVPSQPESVALEPLRPKDAVMNENALLFSVSSSTKGLTLCSEALLSSSPSSGADRPCVASTTAPRKSWQAVRL